jgi:hypothetical protein
MPKHKTQNWIWKSPNRTSFSSVHTRAFAYLHGGLEAAVFPTGRPTEPNTNFRREIQTEWQTRKEISDNSLPPHAFYYPKITNCQPTAIYGKEKCVPPVSVLPRSDELWANLKANSHIACHSHAVPLPCRVAKGLVCVFPIWFTQCGRVWFTLHIFMNQTRPHCVNQMVKTHSKPLAARHGRGTAWARHAMCESALKRVSADW